MLTRQLSETQKAVNSDRLNRHSIVCRNPDLSLLAAACVKRQNLLWEKSKYRLLQASLCHLLQLRAKCWAAARAALWSIFKVGYRVENLFQRIKFKVDEVGYAEVGYAGFYCLIHTVMSKYEASKIKSTMLILKCLQKVFGFLKSCSYQIETILL